MSSPSFTPAALVQRQLEAYNARDIEAFMATWADDAYYFSHPSMLLAQGAAAIRERHIIRFQEPNLHGELLKRVVLGNMVVDHERVTRSFPEGVGQVEVIATYEVAGEKITKAWFIVGSKALSQ
jgi:hypothetical protein